MSFPNIPDITPEINLTMEKSINLILSSIALEEISLSKLIEAETKKILHILEKKDFCCEACCYNTVCVYCDRDKNAPCQPCQPCVAPEGFCNMYFHQEPDIKEVIEVNESVDNIMKDIIKMQMLLQFKLESVQKMLPCISSTETMTSTFTTCTNSKTSYSYSTCMSNKYKR